MKLDRDLQRQQRERCLELACNTHGGWERADLIVATAAAYWAFLLGDGFTVVPALLKAKRGGKALLRAIGPRQAEAEGRTAPAKKARKVRA